METIRNNNGRFDKRTRFMYGLFFVILTGVIIFDFAFLYLNERYDVFHTCDDLPEAFYEDYCAEEGEEGEKMDESGQ